MKAFITFVLFIFLCRFSHAQTAVLDKEQLLNYYQTQRYAEAAQYLKTIYPADTRDLKALTQIAYCLMMAGKIADAEQTYLKINEIQPNTVPVLFSLANINSKRGNELMARHYLENVVQIDSNNFSAFKQLANYTDSTELKLLYLQKASRLNPTEADVAIDLSFLYKTLKRYPLAYRTLKVAIKADTSNFVLLQSLLPIANELKQYREVIEIGEKLLKTAGDANVIKDVGKAYFFLKNYQQTINLYQNLEKIGMQNESTLYYMSLSYRELKNYPMAASYAKKTIEEGISPNISAYYLMLGGIYETNQQFKNAITAFKKGLSFKTNSTIYYRLGLLYDLKLNQKQRALIYYNLYLKSKPDVEEDKAQIDYTKGRLLELKK